MQVFFGKEMQEVSLALSYTLNLKKVNIKYLNQKT